VKGITSIYIGSIREDITNLAKIIRAKCERARHKHESIAVLVDESGFVYAGMCGSGMTFLAMNKHPDWIVAVYSMAYERYRITTPTKDIPYPTPLPTVAEIAADLRERSRELRRAA
jgi:hypothetical protein